MSSSLAISKRLIYLIEQINEWTGKSVAWLTLAMVLTTFAIVILRYTFDIGWIAVQESVAYMHALVFMLGAGYTLKHDGHVRVDIFYQRCSVKTKAWVDCLGALLLLLPVSVFIIWSSWDYVADSWHIQEGSRNSGGLPGLYLLKSSIIVMAFLLILQGFALFLRNLLTAIGYQEETQ
ncbi:TRAP transporter small permease subunit [Methylomarinum sp. Ch1-1]|uniref:TRAP transporter small permease protein n=1 Tax=Methylomarinum roseum TaxID=3067653 RepID=A0AAU7NWC0_9GAMM|nr:TRAP transporter small permease subunit [Methylomarinum sp. Ch1-1]MDP4523046.1 TRAP transporter small permease subunit [Methylomarinum sp. Ch1-1]